MTHTYKMADKNIQISSVSAYVHTYCVDYRVSERPDFTVSTNKCDMDFEREKSRQEDIAMQRHVRELPGPYLETLAVYRKIAEKMLAYDAMKG